MHCKQFLDSLESFMKQIRDGGFVIATIKKTEAWDKIPKFSPSQSLKCTAFFKEKFSHGNFLSPKIQSC